MNYHFVPHISDLRIHFSKIRLSAFNASHLRSLAFFALIVFISHFFHFRDFGLYEDDYSMSMVYRWNWFDLLDQDMQYLQVWPQGRPLHFLLIASLHFIGYRIGGLSSVYVIAFIIVSVNAFLFYVLLKRVSSELVAVTGGLAFTLFPADTTQLLLRHAFGLQTSLLFFIVASLCYLSGKKTLSYVLILGSLLTYENVFFVFFAVPLLKKKWDRSLVIDLIWNALILIGFAVGVFALRLWMSESRVFAASTDTWSVAKTILKAIPLGIETSVGRFIAAPFLIADILKNSNTVEIVTLMLVGVIVLLYRLRDFATTQTTKETEKPVALPSSTISTEWSSKISPDVLQIFKLFLTATVMLCLAYVAAFTPPHYPPTRWYGRLTSVHLAATIGGAILFASVASAFLFALTTARLRKLAMVVLAIYVSLLIGYRVFIQQDFQKSWETQRWVWTNVVKNSPDMTDGTIILIRFDELPPPFFIESSSWADPIILPYIYHFPMEWDNPPRLLAIGSWGAWWPPVTPLAEGRWSVKWSEWHYTLQDSNVIAFKISGKQMLRLQGSITLDGQTIHLKPPQPEIRPTWEKGPLYDLLIVETLLQ